MEALHEVVHQLVDRLIDNAVEQHEAKVVEAEVMLEAMTAARDQLADENIRCRALLEEIAAAAGYPQEQGIDHRLVDLVAEQAQ